MSAPYLDMSFQSLGSTYESRTESSKIPDPSNPNFLQRIVLEVKLPEKSTFAAPLALKVHDVRLGGFLKPIVAVGAVEMETKIPWCLDTYVQVDIYELRLGTSTQ